MGDQRPFNLDKINISRDFEKSAAVQLAKLRTDGQNGDLDAQAHLGVIYYLGVGVPVDWSEAQDWFRKAAERGRPDAQTKLGFMYFMGQGLPKDIQDRSSI
jgi:TPR repeat protein